MKRLEQGDHYVPPVSPVSWPMLSTIPPIVRAGHWAFPHARSILARPPLSLEPLEYPENSSKSFHPCDLGDPSIIIQEVLDSPIAPRPSPTPLIEFPTDEALPVSKLSSSSSSLSGLKHLSL